MLPVQIILSSGWTKSDALIINFEALKANLSHQEEYITALTHLVSVSIRRAELESCHGASVSAIDKFDVLSPFSVKCSLVESRTPSASPSMTKKLDVTISIEGIRVRIDPVVIGILSSLLPLGGDPAPPPSSPRLEIDQEFTAPTSRGQHRRSSSRDHLGHLALAALRLSVTVPSISLAFVPGGEPSQSLIARVDAISSFLHMGWRANLTLEASCAQAVVQLSDSRASSHPLISCGGATVLLSSLYTTGDRIEKALAQPCAEITIHSISVRSSDDGVIRAFDCVGKCLARARYSSSRGPKRSGTARQWGFRLPVILRTGKLSLSHGTLLSLSVSSIHASAGMLQQQPHASGSVIYGQLLSVQLSHLQVADVLKDVNIKMDQITQASEASGEMVVEENLSVTLPESPEGLDITATPEFIQDSLRSLQVIQSARAALISSASTARADVSSPTTQYSAPRAIIYSIATHVDLSALMITLGRPACTICLVGPTVRLSGPSPWRFACQTSTFHVTSDGSQGPVSLDLSPSDKPAILVRSEPSPGSARQSIFVDVHPGLFVGVSPSVMLFLSSLSNMGPSKAAHSPPIENLRRQDSLARAFGFLSSLDFKVNIGSTTVGVYVPVLQGDSPVRIDVRFDQLFLALSSSQSSERLGVLSVVGLYVQQYADPTTIDYGILPDQLLVEPFDISAQLRGFFRDSIHSKRLPDAGKTCHVHAKVEALSLIRVRCFSSDVRILRRLAQEFSKQSGRSQSEPKESPGSVARPYVASLTSLTLHAVAGLPTDSISEDFPPIGSLNISPWFSSLPDGSQSIDGFLLRWRLPELAQISAADFLLTPILQDLSWTKTVIANLSAFSCSIDFPSTHLVAEASQTFGPYNPSKDHGSIPMLSLSATAAVSNNLNALSDAWALRIRFSEPLASRQLVPESLLSLLSCIDVQLSLSEPLTSASSVVVDLSLDRSLELELSLTGERHFPLQASTALTASFSVAQARARVTPSPFGQPMTSMLVDGELSLHHESSADLRRRPIVSSTAVALRFGSVASKQEFDLSFPSGIDLEVSPGSIVELARAVSIFERESAHLSNRISVEGLSEQIVIVNGTTCSFVFGQVSTNERLIVRPEQTFPYSWRKSLSPSQRSLEFRIGSSSIDSEIATSAVVPIHPLIEKYWSSVPPAREDGAADVEPLRWQSNFILRIDTHRSVLLHVGVKVNEFRVKISLAGSHRIKNESYLDFVNISLPPDMGSLFADYLSCQLTPKQRSVSLLRVIPVGSSSSASLGPQAIALSANPFSNNPDAVTGERWITSPHAARPCFGGFLSLGTQSAGDNSRLTAASISVLRTRSVIKNMFSVRNLCPIAIEFKFEGGENAPDQKKPIVSCPPGQTLPLAFDPSLMIDSSSVTTAAGAFVPLRMRFLTRIPSGWSFPPVQLSMSRQNAPTRLGLYVKLEDTPDKRQVPIAAEIIDDEGVQVLQISCSYVLVNQTDRDFVFCHGASQVAVSQLRLVSGAMAPSALSPDSICVAAAASVPYYWKSADIPISTLSLGLVSPDPTLLNVSWSNPAAPAIGSNSVFLFKRHGSLTRTLYDAVVLSCSRAAEHGAPISLVVRPRYLLSNKCGKDICITFPLSGATKTIRQSSSEALYEWPKSDDVGLDTRLRFSFAGADVTNSTPVLSKPFDVGGTKQRSHVFVPVGSRFSVLALSAVDVSGTIHIAVCEEENPVFQIANELSQPLEIRMGTGCSSDLTGQIFKLEPNDIIDVPSDAESSTSSGSTIFSPPDPKKVCSVSVRFSDAWMDPINLLALSDLSTHGLTLSSGREKAGVQIKVAVEKSHTRVFRLCEISSSSSSFLTNVHNVPKSLHFALRAPRISVVLRDAFGWLSPSSAALPLSPKSQASLLPGPDIWPTQEQVHEVLLLSVETPSVSFSSSTPMKSLFVRLGGIQLDSFLPDAQFPVPASLVPNFTSEEFPIAVDASVVFNALSIDSLVVNFTSELALSLDENLLAYATRLGKRLAILKRLPPTTREHLPQLHTAEIATALTAPPLYVHLLTIQMPSKVRVSAQIRPGKGRLFVSFSDAVFSFKPLYTSRLSSYPDRLLQALISNYLSEAIPQAPVALASLDVLGNPLKLARHVGAGVRDFLVLPIQYTAEKGALGFAEGVVRGSGSLFGHITGGVLQSFSGLSQSLARVLDPESQGVLGVTSIVTQPIKAVQSSGFSGLARGLTTGLFRAITAPIGGALDFVSATTSDLSDSVLATPQRWVRPPRAPIPSPHVPEHQSFGAAKVRSKILPFEFKEPVQLQSILVADVIGVSAEAPCLIVLCSCRVLIVMMNEEVLLLVKSSQVKKLSSQANTLVLDRTTLVRFSSQAIASLVTNWAVK